MPSYFTHVLAGLACLIAGLAVILRAWRIGDWVCTRLIRLSEIMQIDDLAGNIPLGARQGLVFGLSMGGLTLILFAVGFFYQGYLAAHGVYKIVIR